MRLYLALGFSNDLQAIARRLQARPDRAKALSLLLANSGLGIKAVKADTEYREIVERFLKQPDDEQGGGTTSGYYSSYPGLRRYLASPLGQ